jgi:hypothetical protein
VAERKEGGSGNDGYGCVLLLVSRRRIAGVGLTSCAPIGAQPSSRKPKTGNRKLQNMPCRGKVPNIGKEVTDCALSERGGLQFSESK